MPLVGSPQPMRPAHRVDFDHPVKRPEKKAGIVSGPSTSSETSKGVPNASDYWISFGKGVAAGATDVGAGLPFHNIKNRLQFSAARCDGRSPWAPPYYSGWRAALALQVPVNVGMFTGFDLFLQWMYGTDNPTAGQRLAGVGFSTFASSVIASPFEALIISDGNSTAPTKGILRPFEYSMGRNTYSRLVEAYLNEQFYLLYRGLMASLARDMGYAGAMFGLSPVLAPRCLRFTPKTWSPVRRKQASILIATGGTCGVAGYLSAPADWANTQKKVYPRITYPQLWGKAWQNGRVAGVTMLFKSGPARALRLSVTGVAVRWTILFIQNRVDAYRLGR